ncbi:hypothetical protein TNCV_409511 [Trichonephila clavipes]|nr:hypothetical protein TNCV_409511 [Trichonephila clavipes]
MKEGLIGSSYVCPKCGKSMELRERTGALVASTWSTKITDSDAENELSDTLPENILELFNSDTDESDFEGFR